MSRPDVLAELLQADEPEWVAAIVQAEFFKLPAANPYPVGHRFREVYAAAYRQVCEDEGATVRYEGACELDGPTTGRDEE